MRQFSIFTAPYYCFFSRALFVDVGRRWRAGTFGYLLLLLALANVPFMLELRTGWAKFLRDEAPTLIAQIPPITIENGRVDADVEQPHFIRTWCDDVIAIIDTTGQVRSLDGTSATFLLTESQLISKKSERETRVYDLSTIHQFYVDGPTAERWLRVFGKWQVILLYPIVVVGSFGYRVVQALFYSLFGLMIVRVLRSGLSYQGILRVTVVAFTPAILLKALFGIAGVSFPMSWLVYFLVAMGYLAFGLGANRRDATPGGSVAPRESSA